MTQRLGGEGRHRLYGDLAYLWPLMSPPEEYADGAPHWRNQLLTRLGPNSRHVLELGTGGGHFISHLTDVFQVTAVDLSEDMLDNARRLNPGVEHIVGDMRGVRLGRTFDAVLIHDAIAYITAEDDLSDTFATARAHLEPGGVFITMPDHYIDRPVWPYINNRTHKQDDRELTYIEYSAPDINETSLLQSTFIFVITENGERRIELDHHTTGLFPVETWRRLIEAAGFKVERMDYPVADGPISQYLWVGTAV